MTIIVNECWCSTISQRKRKRVVENGRLWTSSIPGNNGNRAIQSHNAVSTNYLHGTKKNRQTSTIQGTAQYVHSYFAEPLHSRP